MNYPEVFEDGNLIPGEYYWVEDKSSGIFNAHEVVAISNAPNGPKAFYMDRMFIECSGDNSQFFQNYRVYGPIVKPNLYCQRTQ